METLRQIREADRRTEEMAQKKEEMIAQRRRAALEVHILQCYSTDNPTEYTWNHTRETHLRSAFFFVPFSECLGKEVIFKYIFGNFAAQSAQERLEISATIGVYLSDSTQSRVTLGGASGGKRYTNSGTLYYPTSGYNRVEFAPATLKEHVISQAETLAAKI